MPSAVRPPEPLLEPLTGRERDILRLLADGLTNHDIAQQLVLSLGTVKWYNTQIFGKLGVRNRTQAIKRARELSLLDYASPESAAPAETPVTSDEASASQTPHNLPVQPVPFIGRVEELAEIARLLATPDCRLLTLVGPGGIGKTYLAVKAAAEQLSRFPDGVYFVSLAPLSSPEDIVSALAQAMSLPFAEGQGLGGQLLAHLSRKTILLVLDNFDELLSGAGLLSDILQAAPRVKVLATSRERLNLQEETILRIGGMRVPEPDQAQPALDNDAVMLFVQTARRVQPGFQLTSDVVGHIARICQWVEGMPLGIVLAASWLGVMSPSEIAGEITHSQDFLAAELRNIPARHRSIRMVFESSWNLLAPNERDAFADVSVFRGSFTREAAQHVTGAGLRVLMALVNKSLLQRDAAGRLHVHELLRQFAADRLDQSGLSGAIRDAHSRYYLTLLGQRAGLSHSSMADEIEADFDNLRAAWNHAVDQSQFDLIESALNSLYDLCARRSRYQDAERLFGRAVELADAQPGALSAKTVLRLRECRGRVRGLLGDFDGAIADLSQVRDDTRRMGDRIWERAALIGLGQMYRKTGRGEDAALHLSQALMSARAGGDARVIADTLYHIGTVTWDEGDNAQCMAYHQEAVDISRRLGLRDLVAVQAVHGLGEAALMDGQSQFATQCFSESLDLAREIDDLGYEAENLQMIGWTGMGTVGTGDYLRAWESLSQSLALSQRAHLDWHSVCTLSGLGMVEGCLGHYGDGLAHLQQSLRLAEGLGLRRFMTLALDGLGELYLHLNLLDLAQAVHERGLQLMLQMESTYWLPRLQANLAINRLRQGDLAVEPELRAALDLALSRRQGMHATRCLEGLAEAAIARRQPDQALGYLDRLAGLAERGGMREVKAKAHRWRGEALLLMARLDEAEAELTRALDWFTEVGTPRHLRDTHLALAELCRARGHAIAAQQHEAIANDCVARMAASLPDAELRVGLAELIVERET